MRSSDVIGVHIENFVDINVYRFRGWVVQLLQFVVQPHLDGQPLPDEAHLVRAVLGREEFLPPLLHLALFGKVDPQPGAARRSLTVVHGFNAALHLPASCWWSTAAVSVPDSSRGPGQSSENIPRVVFVSSTGVWMITWCPKPKYGGRVVFPKVSG